MLLRIKRCFFSVKASNVQKRRACKLLHCLKISTSVERGSSSIVCILYAAIIINLFATVVTYSTPSTIKETGVPLSIINAQAIYIMYAPVI